MIFPFKIFSFKKVVKFVNYYFSKETNKSFKKNLWDKYNLKTDTNNGKLKCIIKLELN